MRERKKDYHDCVKVISEFGGFHKLRERIIDVYIIGSRLGPFRLPARRFIVTVFYHKT